MKCEICGSNVETTFLSKIMGSYVKDEKGKKHAVCSSCQNKFQSKAGILTQLNK